MLTLCCNLFLLRYFETGNALKVSVDHVFKLRRILAAPDHADDIKDMNITRF